MGYIDNIGFQATDTSMAAALSLANTANARCELVLAQVTVADAEGATANEIGLNLGWSRMSVQPRLSDLRRLGKIGDCGIRRKNKSGRQAIAWVVADLVPATPAAEVLPPRSCDDEVATMMDRLSRFQAWLVREGAARGGDRGLISGASLAQDVRALLVERCFKKGSRVHG